MITDNLTARAKRAPRRPRRVKQPLAAGVRRHTQIRPHEFYVTNPATNRQNWPFETPRYLGVPSDCACTPPA